MSKKPETLFKDRIMPQLEALPNTFVYKTQEVSKRGISDLNMCINGLYVTVELKKSINDEPDPLQRWMMQKVAAAGGIALLAYPENWDTVYNILLEIAHRGKIPDQRILDS